MPTNIKKINRYREIKGTFDILDLVEEGLEDLLENNFVLDIDLKGRIFIKDKDIKKIKSVISKRFGKVAKDCKKKIKKGSKVFKV